MCPSPSSLTHSPFHHPTWPHKNSSFVTIVEFISGSIFDNDTYWHLNLKTAHAAGNPGLRQPCLMALTTLLAEFNGGCYLCVYYRKSNWIFMLFKFTCDVLCDVFSAFNLGNCCPVECFTHNCLYSKYWKCIREHFQTQL